MTGFVLHPRRLDRDRAWSLLAVAIVHAALGWALLTGLGISLPDQAQDVLASFDVADPPPPPASPPPTPPRPAAQHAPRKAGAAAPPNLRSRATPVTAPDTVVPIPPPVMVAALPGVGANPASGNANRAGPGTGSGGVGTGTGSGRDGDGPGGGGGGGQRARLVRAGLGDYPCDPPKPCYYGVVGLRFVVGTDGRVADCRVTRTSGFRELDDYTCDRIRQRLRYRPALDRNGRKVPDIVIGDQEWTRPDGSPDDRGD